MRVGKEVQRQVMAEELKRRKAQPLQMSAEDRKKIYDGLMTLPKDRQIPALRSAGLDEEADLLEQQRAEEHLEELRQERLDAINALPVEERMVALIEGGFTEEAKALSEQLAAEKKAEEEETAETAEEQTEEAPESVEDTAEPEVKEEAPKKKGRPKKQKK